MPQKSDGRDGKHHRKESFFQKNGKKQGIFYAKVFAIAFVRRLMYCIMVICAACDTAAQILDYEKILYFLTIEHKGAPR